VSWSSTFVAAIEAGESIRIRLSWAGATVATSDGSGGWAMTRMPVVSGWGLQLRTWQCSLPVMSFEIAATPAEYQAITGQVVLGSVVSVFAEFSGGTERIWRGRILDYSMGGIGDQTRVRIDVSDLVAYTLDRIPTGSTYPAPLFDGVGRKAPQRVRLGMVPFDDFTLATVKAEYTTLASGFTPGVSTELDVGSTTSFTLGYDFANSTPIAAAVLAKANGTEGFVYFAAKTSTKLQTLTYPQMPGGTPANPPFATSYAIASEVYPVAVVAGHPFAVIQSVWTSTGVSLANGPYDRLPSAWAQGIPYGEIDATDANRWSALVYTSSVGSDPWTAIQTRVEWESGADLYAWAAPLGIWPVTRQGQLTLRAAIVPASAGATVIAGVVNDSNIVALGRHKVRAAGCDAEYRALPFSHATYHAVGAAGNPTEVYVLGRSNLRPVTRPAQYSPAPLDLNQHVIGETAPIAQDLDRRVAPWACRVAFEVEGVELWGAAVGWVPGDIVRVTSAAIPIGGGATAQDTPAVWIPEEVDWGSRTARGRLVFLPAQ